MPGYSFQPQFVDPIRDGTKGGTIRAARRIPQRWSDTTRSKAAAYGNHAHVGDRLHLWCKLRTPQAFKIAEVPCVGAEPITLCVGADDAVLFSRRFMRITTHPHLNTFAVFDGFECWQELREFWGRQHPGQSEFAGWHIRWLPLPGPIDQQYQAERIERARAADWDENQGAA